jgi:hypothetical protein
MTSKVWTVPARGIRESDLVRFLKDTRLDGNFNHAPRNVGKTAQAPLRPYGRVADHTRMYRAAQYRAIVVAI